MFDPILLVLLAMLAASLYLAFSVINQAKSAQLSPKRRRNWLEMRKVFNKSKGNKNHSKVIKYNSPGLSGLWHQLLIRVQFDIPTAERLVNGLKWKHPGKSDRWLIEKAIHDLERDRRP